MTLLERLPDPEGDRIEAQERMDRLREKGSVDVIELGPIDRCKECGCLPVEMFPSHWGCACDLPFGVG
jgi:hypothetical protein